MFVVTGASGNVGSEVASALSGAGEHVRALTRGGDRPPGLPAQVEVVAGDLDRPASLSEVLAGATGVFLLPGYQDMPGVLSEVRRAGVEHVVLLSGTSARDRDMSNAVSAYMIRSEDAVTGSGVAWTVLRSYGFMSNALRWIPQLRAGEVVREPFASVAVAAIDPYDIGAVAATVLRSLGHEGRHYLLSGPEALLPAERLRILGEALGRELRMVALTDEEARTRMEGEMPAEYVDAFFDFSVGGALDETQPQGTVRQLLGRDPRTFAQWATTHASAFL